MDREKLIEELDSCILMARATETKLIHIYVEQAEEILTLLKEQGAVEPKYNARTNWYECGACHYSMTSGIHCRSELIPAYKVGYCAKCGQEVKWE